MQTTVKQTYSIWQAVSVALRLSAHAIEEVRAIGAKVPAEGPPGKDGRDGIDGKDGKSIDPLSLRELIQAEVARVVAELPTPKDGRDGIDGKDGAPGAPGDRGPPGEAGPPGRDGVGVADALIDREGSLALTLSDGSLRQLGHVVGRDGSDGAPGFDIDELSLEKDGDRTLVLCYRRGDQVKEIGRATFDVQLYRGIYEDGRAYAVGDTVTYSGSQWYCRQPTSDRPKATGAWVLAVKRGEPGKDGRDGVRASLPLKIEEPKNG